MGHLVELIACGLVKARVVVTVYYAPPGGGAVNQGVAVAQVQVYPVGPTDRVDGVGVGEGGIRVPDMGLVEGQELFAGQCCLIRCLSHSYFECPFFKAAQLTPDSPACVLLK